MNTPTPEVGDVWEDNDPRSNGRRLLVVAVSRDYVRCNATTGRKVTIAVSRFRNRSNGYRLIHRYGEPSNE